MLKRIILCADDYGQNSAISQAIIDLLEKNRLATTSCLTTVSQWPELAKLLKPHLTKADIGLHFNLTEGTALTAAFNFKKLPQLILLSQLRCIKKTAIKIELNAQIDRFSDTLGCMPNFIDGHQHVHQFPIIRDALFDVYEEKLRKFNIYLRCTYNEGDLKRLIYPSYLKQSIINLSGAIGFKKQLCKYNIPHNTSFSGIYNFDTEINYDKLFPQFAHEIKNNGIIMCHPASQFSENDTIQAARLKEYQYFASQQFQDFLNQNNFTIGRLSEHLTRTDKCPTPQHS